MSGKPNSWPCWSCKHPVSMRERADADGQCPRCAVELDLEDWPFPSTHAVLPFAIGRCANKHCGSQAREISPYCSKCEPDL